MEIIWEKYSFVMRQSSSALLLAYQVEDSGQEV